MSPPPFVGFPKFLISKTQWFRSGRKVTKVRLNKKGRGDNLTAEVAVSTSDDESSWNSWETLPLNSVVTLQNPGEYMRIAISGMETTEFYSQDSRGVDVGVEVEVRETIAA